MKIKAAEFAPPEAPGNQKSLSINKDYVETEELALRLLECDLDDISIDTFIKLFNKVIEQSKDIIEISKLITNGEVVYACKEDM